MRAARSCVLPLPGHAMTRTGPYIVSTARRCLSLRDSRMSEKDDCIGI